MRIRPIQDDDTDAVIGLWRQCGLLRPWNDPVADIALARKTESAEIFVGTTADNSIDAAVMCGHDGHRGWLYYLAVSPRTQRQGFGKLMVAHAEQWLRDRDVPKLELMIRNTNTVVGQFYESIGYRTEPVVTMSRWLHRPAVARDD